MADPSKHNAQVPIVSPAVRQRLQQLFEHGKRSLEKSNHDYAHDMFSQCVAEDPTNLIYLQHLRTNLERKHGPKPKASRFAGYGLKRSSGVAKSVAKGKWQEAFKAGCDSLGKNPFDVANLLEMGDACGTLGHRESQLFYQRWALDIDSNSEAANRAAAATFEAVGLFDQAIACLQRVQKVKPSDHEVGRMISHLSVEKTIKKGGYNEDLLRKGDNAAAMPQAGAVKVGSSANSASPKVDAEPVAKVNDEARWLDAIRLHPAELSNYLELADHYTRLDRLRDAERVLTKAFSVTGSGNLDIRERIEEAQLRRMRQQVDVAHRKADVEKTPETRELAKKMIAQANQVELEVYAARATRHPQDLRYQFELAMRLKRAGKHREAVAHFQQARNEPKKLAETQLNLGECFQQIEQYRLAMGSYEAAIAAAEKTDAELLRLALYRLGVLATGLKDFDKAEKHLTRLADLDFGYRDVADRLDKLAQMRNT